MAVYAWIVETWSAYFITVGLGFLVALVSLALTAMVSIGFYWRVGVSRPELFPAFFACGVLRFALATLVLRWSSHGLVVVSITIILGLVTYWSRIVYLRMIRFGVFGRTMIALLDSAVGFDHVIVRRVVMEFESKYLQDTAKLRKRSRLLIQDANFRRYRAEIEKHVLRYRFGLGLLLGGPRYSRSFQEFFAQERDSEHHPQRLELLINTFGLAEVEAMVESVNGTNERTHDRFRVFKKTRCRIFVDGREAVGTMREISCGGAVVALIGDDILAIGQRVVLTLENGSSMECRVLGGKGEGLWRLQFHSSITRLHAGSG